MQHTYHLHLDEPLQTVSLMQVTTRTMMKKRMKQDAADRKAVKLKKHNKPMKPQPEELFKFNGHIAADDSLAIVHQFFADLPYDDQNQLTLVRMEATNKSQSCRSGNL